jgi:hypothetical protein
MLQLLSVVVFHVLHREESLAVHLARMWPPSTVTVDPTSNWSALLVNEIAMLESSDQAHCTKSMSAKRSSSLQVNEPSYSAWSVAASNVSSTSLPSEEKEQDCMLGAGGASSISSTDSTLPVT